MINILRAPDDIKIECEANNADCTVETEIKDEKLYVFISAAVARPRFICLRWNYRVTEPTQWGINGSAPTGIWNGTP